MMIFYNKYPFYFDETQVAEQREKSVAFFHRLTKIQAELEENINVTL